MKWKNESANLFIFIVKRMFWRYIEIEWKTCVFFEIFRLMVIIDDYN